MKRLFPRSGPPSLQNVVVWEHQIYAWYFGFRVQSSNVPINLAICCFLNATPSIRNHPPLGFAKPMSLVLGSLWDGSDSLGSSEFLKSGLQALNPRPSNPKR